MPTAPLIALDLPDLSALQELAEGELIALQASLAAVRRRVDAGSATVAGEIARRSTRELGYAGLAQRSGSRDAAGLVAAISGVSISEARDLVEVGEFCASDDSWLGELQAGVANGSVSVATAATVHRSLGVPTESVTAKDLADAVHVIVGEDDQGGSSPGRGGVVGPEAARRRARELRDALDSSGVHDREAALRSKRYLRLVPRHDGMTNLFGLLDPESAALVTDAIDLVTSPRRGGPRFVDPVQVAAAQRVIDDERSTDQIALDALVDMVRIAAAADPGRVFGVRRPSVRLHVALDDLERGTGAAHVEGQIVGVSMGTVRRHICVGGVDPILFDGSGKVLDHGRSRRLFDENQRVVLAAIWGGCAVEGCDRPPSWTEAHHVEEWDRHRGRTDVADGVLLCRHHHLLLHNNGWRIDRSHRHWMMLPPPGDEAASALALVSKNPVRRSRGA